MAKTIVALSLCAGLVLGTLSAHADRAILTVEKTACVESGESVFLLLAQVAIPKEICHARIHHAELICQASISLSADCGGIALIPAALGRDWDPGSVTWDSLQDSADGGIRDGNGPVPSFGEGESYTLRVNVTDIVRSWCGPDGRPNHGVIIRPAKAESQALESLRFGSEVQLGLVYDPTDRRD